MSGESENLRRLLSLPIFTQTFDLFSGPGPRLAWECCWPRPTWSPRLQTGFKTGFWTGSAEFRKISCCAEGHLANGQIQNPTISSQYFNPNKTAAKISSEFCAKKNLWWTFCQKKFSKIDENFAARWSAIFPAKTSFQFWSLHRRKKNDETQQRRLSKKNSRNTFKKKNFRLSEAPVKKKNTIKQQSNGILRGRSC